MSDKRSCASEELVPLKNIKGSEQDGHDADLTTIDHTLDIDDDVFDTGGKGQKLDGKDDDDDDEEESEEDDPNAPDGGWGWGCVMGCAISQIVIAGFERSAGIIILYIKSHFQSSVSDVAWIVSLSGTFRLLFGPVASVLSNKFSSRSVVISGGLLFSCGLILSAFVPDLRYLYVTYGVGCGLGKALAYAPGLVIVGQYFNKHRGLAVGIATAGGGIGTLLLPLLIDYLFEEFQYRGAFILFAGFSLQILISGCLYMPLEKYINIIQRKRETDVAPEQFIHGVEGVPLTSRRFSRSSNRKPSLASRRGSEKHREKSARFCGLCAKTKHLFSHKDAENIQKKKLEGEKKKKLFDVSLLKNPVFLLLCFAVLFLAIAFNSVIVFIPPLAKSLGLSSMEGAIVISVAGVFDTIGRIFAGLILDHRKLKPFRMIAYNVALFILTFLTFCLAFVHSYWQLLLVAIFYGFFVGTYTSQKSVILADLLGSVSLSSSFAILICFQGIGTLVGPPIIGYIKDAKHSFQDGFFFSSGVNLLGALILSSGNIFKCYSEKANTNNENKS